MIYIGCDHAGFQLKEKIKSYLIDNEYQIKDFGCYSEESVDYPDIIHPLAKEINENENLIGIIMCGSGNGVSMTANKYPNVRVALSWNKEIAELGKLHNNANVLALPARFIEESEALKCVEIFLNSEFEGGRHQRRVEKIKI
ncbi:MAG: ribose 5-phosphate isomerase B [Saprospiraceae bacterium]|nr:ribose 5-phosphate isomerase B [Saprospiraceae bacterium]